MDLRKLIIEIEIPLEEHTVVMNIRPPYHQGIQHLKTNLFGEITSKL